MLERSKKLSVHVRYNTQVARINETTDSVNVSFQNGDVESYELVVGADGIHSGLRKMVFGEEHQFSHYLGYGVAAFQTAHRDEIGSSVKIYQEPNRSSIYYPVSGKAMDSVFLFPCENTERVAKEDYKNVLLNTYAGSKWINQEVIQNTPNDSIGFFDVLKQIQMPTWMKSRVCLVRDACACLSPIAGQGASTAMLEAYVLSNELKKSTNVQECLARYESILKPDIECRQALARHIANRFVPASVKEIVWYRWLTRMEFSSLLVHRTANGFKGKIHQI